MALCTVTGNINNILGQNAASGTVRFTLTNFGQGAIPLVSGTNLIVPVTTDVVVAANGSFTVNLQGNDTITPANTLYAVTYYAPSGAIGPILYSLTGSSVNLNSATPVSVAPAILLPTSAAANAVFAGPTTGAPSTPTFRPLVLADLPAGISVTFANVLAGTNANALAIGTGGSLVATGSGTITATSVPFSGVAAGTNTSALVIGSAGSLSVGGTGTISATGVISSTANPALSGVVRLASGDAVKFRNAANGADLNAMTSDGTDNLILGGIATNSIQFKIGGSAGSMQYVATNTLQGQLNLPFTIQAFSTSISGQILNLFASPATGSSSVGGAINITAGTGGFAGGGGGGDIVLTPGDGTLKGKVTMAAGFLYYPPAFLFAALGTPANGALVYCSDCTIANPCAGVGTGAMAKRLNGVWVCN